VLYATHSTSPETAAVLQHAHVGQRSRTHGPRLPDDQHRLSNWSPHNVIIHLNSYRLSREILNVYLNPRSPRTGDSIAQNTIIPGAIPRSSLARSCIPRFSSSNSDCTTTLPCQLALEVVLPLFLASLSYPRPARVSSVSASSASPAICTLTCRLTSKRIKTRPRHFSLLDLNSAELSTASTRTFGGNTG